MSLPRTFRIIHVQISAYRVPFAVPSGGIKPPTLTVTEPVIMAHLLPVNESFFKSDKSMTKDRPYLLLLNVFETRRLYKFP